MATESQNISSLEICTQKLHPKDHEEHKEIHENKNNTKHDIKKLSAAFWVKKVWPIPSTITYSFIDKKPTIPRKTFETFAKKSSPVDPLQKEVDKLSIIEAVKTVINKRIQPMVAGSLTFKFIEDTDKANLRISFDKNGGSWSLVGTDCLEQKKGATINFGWFDVPTTIHEFCHVLGLIHEHQNPISAHTVSKVVKYKMPDGNTCNTSDGGIPWNIPKVLEWAESSQGWDNQTTCNNIIQKYDVNQLNGSYYDPCSIMLYFFPSDLLTHGDGPS